MPGGVALGLLHVQGTLITKGTRGVNVLGGRRIEGGK